MKEWLTDIKTDFLKKEFAPLKILFFFMIGGMATLFPFLTIQARSLGITGEELGIIYSLLPVVGIFAPSLAGLFADKIGNFKFLSSFSVACSGLAALLFILIPPGRITHVLPEQLPLTINCSMSHSSLKINYPFNCDPKRNTQDSIINIEFCSYKCINNKRKHLQNQNKNLLESWCRNKINCTSFSEVEIENIDKINSNISRGPYDVNDPDLSSDTINFIFNNRTLPIKFSASADDFGIEDSFCPLMNEENEECWLQCQAFADSSKTCKNKKSVETLNPSLTIIYYIVIRLINGITLATSFTLFEGAVVAIVKQHNGDLGLQRLFGNFGVIVMTPISGKLIDYYSLKNNSEDYTPAFILYCGIKLFSAFILLFINLEFKQPSNRVIKDFKELVAQPRVLSFIILVLVAGTSYGFIETFLFWLLEDLGADKSLMGMTVTVGAAFGIPLLMSSMLFIRKFGHVNTLSLCMVFYFIRLLGYSFITNPWMAMPFEAMEGFTNSLMTVTCISYAGVLSTPSTVASLQGLYGGTYHGAGRGIGSLTGGIMIKHLGNAGTFQTLSASCAVGGIVYFLVNKFILGENEELKDNDNQREHENDSSDNLDKINSTVNAEKNYNSLDNK